ncbi:MAG: hypothetical protein KGH63_02740, partial [Candidatus Micrarchaeota archaeon]|nr:hypothetical protein [Candidatus Micrarchaeota archaeon]
ANLSSPSSPPAMDMFSDPLPAISSPAAPSAATFTPPLSGEVVIQPAPPAPESGLAGLASLMPPPLPAPTFTPAQEVIQAREPQGLEALEDPLPSMMDTPSEDVIVEPLSRPLTPALRKSEKEVLDEHLDSMYRK